MADDKARSRRALDALNFCNAGIQTGLVPFMSVFYSSERHWNPGQIGLLIACQSLAGVALQSLTGHLVDESRHKKLLTGVAALIVSLSAVGIALLKSFPAQIAVQLVIGAAITVFPTATAAFSLGLSSEQEVSGRVARNESFTHFGNAFFAIAAGLVGALIALAGIFYAAAVFAAGMAVSVFFIEQEKVNYEAAREGQGEQGGSERKGWRDLIRDHRILIFTAAVVLFNVSNQATLPLVAQLLSKSKHGRSAAWQIAAAVFVAEAVMILIALFAGKKADQWGRKPLFLAAFGFLALRNGLSVASHNPFFLISLQAFDGVAAAIYGVLLTLITADLAKGTGRFNFLQGSIQSAMGLGGFLSNLGFGALAKTAGFNASFLGLSATAVAGGLLYQLKMPETRE
jgi:MFS family permease